MFKLQTLPNGHVLLLILLFKHISMRHIRNLALRSVSLMFLTSFRNDFESIVYLLWYFIDTTLTLTYEIE